MEYFHIVGSINPDKFTKYVESVLLGFDKYAVIHDTDTQKLRGYFHTTNSAEDPTPKGFWTFRPEVEEVTAERFKDGIKAIHQYKGENTEFYSKGVEEYEEQQDSRKTPHIFEELDYLTAQPIPRGTNLSLLHAIQDNAESISATSLSLLDKYMGVEVSIPHFSIADILAAPDPEPLMFLNGKPLLIAGQLNVLTGGPKTGKSTFTAYILSELTQLGNRCAVFDSEQGITGLKEYIRRQCKYTKGEPSDMVEYYDIQPYQKQHEKAMAVIVQAVRETKPDFVVVDSFRHLLNDPKDDNEIERLSGELQALAQETTVLTTIHTNKSGEKAYSSMSGFSGSELERAASNVILLRNEAKEGEQKVISVRTLLARYWGGQDYGRFVFDESEVMGKPCSTCQFIDSTQTQQERATEIEYYRTLFERILQGRTMKYRELITAYSSATNKSGKTAERKISHAKSIGVLVCESNLYRLNPDTNRKEDTSEDTMPF